MQTVKTKIGRTIERTIVNIGISLDVSVLDVAVLVSVINVSVLSVYKSPQKIVRSDSYFEEMSIIITF